jgi:hypothetical protein
MIPEPIVAPTHPAEPAVQPTTQGVEQPAPSAQQQRVADDVFTEEQGKVVAGLLAIQTGLGLLHNLAVDAKEQAKVDNAPPPRKLPEPDEEEKS